MTRNEFPLLPALSRPAFADMMRCYDTYRANRGRVLGEGAHIQHQCGVRMSVALERCGILLDTVRGSHRRTINDSVFYTVEGATTLANHLGRLWHGPDKTAEISSFQREFAGLKGIIHLQDYRHRGEQEYSPDPEGELSGDHIDIWDGTRMGNSIIRDRTRDSTMPTRAQLEASVELARDRGRHLRPRAEFFALPDVPMFSLPDLGSFFE